MPSQRSRRTLAGVLTGVVLTGISGCSVIDSLSPDPTQVSLTEAPSASSTPSATASAAAASGSANPSPSAPATLQDAFEQVSSGVVRLEVAGCESDGMGTGFAIDDQLVVTAAHVVDGGRLVRAISGTSSRSASVLGLDTTADVALLRMVTPVSGHRFAFSQSPARVGDQVAAIGFPQASLLTFTPGTVNGLGRKAVVDGVARFGLMEFDAATHPGSSGGPVIRPDGTVVGLVDAGPQAAQGRRLAVTSQTVRTTIEPWMSRTSPVPTRACPEALGPDGQPVPPNLAKGSDVDQAFGTLRLYFASINQGDYSTALAQFVRPLPLAAFSAGVESSQDEDFQVRDVQRTGGKIRIWLTFTSRQQAGRGPAARPQETCTDWSLDYTMAPRNGLWLIESTKGHGTASQPCAAG
ncbi:MAG: trypsin-like peptidase domain-containing protein [Kineosporiaceae bacterium]|nr:trypsin-like peptidase domain-containing protein [Kineosporiaceae bacterium]